MLVQFFDTLKTLGVPVTIRELLDLHEALDRHLVFADLDQFYYLARLCLVKDERHLDRFDQVFGHVFKGLDYLNEVMGAEIPDEWLQKLTEKFLTEEEKAQIEALGGWEKIMEELKKRLEEQNERHEGGNKWIGTGGTSPFGNSGYHPEGIRIGGEGRQGRAVKVWEKRRFRNLDGDVEIGTAPPAPLRAGGRADGARSARYDQVHCTPGLARHQDGARAPQHGEGTDLLRRGRIDGSAYPSV